MGLGMRVSVGSWLAVHLRRDDMCGEEGCTADHGRHVAGDVAHHHLLRLLHALGTEGYTVMVQVLQEHLVHHNVIAEVML